MRRGGCAAKKSCEATLARADGVVLIRIMIFLTSTTPAAATASAFPSSAEEGSCDSRVGQQPHKPWVRNTHETSALKGRQIFYRPLTASLPRNNGFPMPA